MGVKATTVGQWRTSVLSCLVSPSGKVTVYCQAFKINSLRQRCIRNYCSKRAFQNQYLHVYPSLLSSSVLVWEAILFKVYDLASGITRRNNLTASSLIFCILQLLDRYYIHSTSCSLPTRYPDHYYCSLNFSMSCC